MLRYLVACLALLLPIAGAAVAIDPRIGHSNSAVHEANLATTEEAHARVEASRIAADERRAAALDTEAKEVSHQDSKKKHLEYKKFSNKKKHNLHKVRMTNAINDIVEHLDQYKDDRELIHTGIYSFDWECASSESLTSEETTKLVVDASCVGTVPTELGRLTGLTYLDFSSSGITGSIPSELEALTALTFLGGANALAGTIPSALSALTSLTITR